MRMDEGPTSQGPKVQMWDACPRSKLAVCAGQSSRDKQAWYLPGERDHAVHTSIHWRPIIHTWGPSGEVGPTVSIYWGPSGEVGPTVYTSIYWGITRGGGAHCLRFHLLGNFQGRRGPLSILHLLWNLQGKWAPLSPPPSTGKPPGEVDPLSTLPSTGEPPGEVGPTVYTSCYWGTSRGSGRTVYTSIYSGTSRGSGFHCLHLHPLGNLQVRRGPLSTPLSTGEPPEGKWVTLSTPPSTGRHGDRLEAVLAEAVGTRYKMSPAAHPDVPGLKSGI